MPIYEFTCDSCGMEVDIELPVDKCSDSIDCPQCDSKLRRAFRTAPKVRFIGEGWPDKDRIDLKAKYKKRNARIENMPPANQKKMKKFMDDYNVKKYII